MFGSHMKKKVISEYCLKHNTTIPRFARGHQFGDTIIYLYDYGLRFPGYKNLLKLYYASHGEITANDFVDYASVDLDTPINDTNEPESNNDH